MITAEFHHSDDEVFHRLMEQYWGFYITAAGEIDEQDAILS